MTVKDKVTIKGSGDIDTMTVYVSGVTSSIRPDTVKTKDNASKPDYTGMTMMIGLAPAVPAGISPSAVTAAAALTGTQLSQKVM